MQLYVLYIYSSYTVNMRSLLAICKRPSPSEIFDAQKARIVLGIFFLKKNSRKKNNIKFFPFIDKFKQKLIIFFLSISIDNYIYISYTGRRKVRSVCRRFSTGIFIPGHFTPILFTPVYFSPGHFALRLFSPSAFRPGNFIVGYIATCPFGFIL